ncbi:MAG TPA: 3'-5' exonuclease, partial [Alphaproteobacteria bacterium]|nr:3'-5' exonuclease [Alphaproteobacteria bacterium]
HVLSEIAVLVRAGFQTRLFEERFLEVGLPYRVIGGLRFYERQEIRDAVAYIRMLAQPDDGLAFERILNVPKRGLGDAVLQTLHRTARNEGVSLPAAAAQLIGTDEIRPRQRTALRELLAQFALWRARLSEKPHPEVVQIVLDESGYTEMWQRDRSPTAPGRLENLKELIRALEEFETLAAFLDHVSLVMDLTEAAGSDLVNIMTLHSAKGLEFDTVFLPGWEEGLFPHQLALDEKGAAGLEEERRLAYVGLTRARRRATVLWAANRHVYNQWVSSIPSRFIDELPKEHIEIETLIAAAAPRSLPSGAGFSEDSPVFGPPGFHSRRARRTLEASYRTSAAAEESASAFAIGQRIFHQKFGYGRVLEVEGNKLAIAFDKAGEKKVIASFVEPA